MRYLLQLLAMLGDLAIIGAAACLVYSHPLNIFSWIISAVAFLVWQKQGGFIAWQPARIRQFLDNAKRIGL